MSQTFFAILTAIGEAKHQNAALLGQKVQYAQMAVGDGNGSVPMPSRDQRKLVNQVNIAPINQAFIDPANKSEIVIEQVIPETVGGWWIREAGIFDVEGDLIAVANVPPTYKPQMTEGSGRTQVIRIVLLLSDVSVVSLKIDPAVVLATRQYADELFNRPSGVTADSYGSKSKYPIFKVNERGAVTYAAEIETASVWDAIPEQNIGDIIFVKGLGEMWWTESAFFTGYRTKYCGFPIQNLDRVDRSFTLALDGGFFDKTQPKYRGLYGWILENNLMVPAADYKDKEGFFCEAGGNMIKTPNQLDVFWRNIGTDADTANARALGSAQSEAIKQQSPQFQASIDGGATWGVTRPALDVNSASLSMSGVANIGMQVTKADINTSGDGWNGIGAYGLRIAPFGSSETRPNNTALRPRIQI